MQCSFNPSQVEALLAKAETLCELGLSEAALDDYNAVVALSEQNVIARVNRATIHFEQSKFGKALSDMNRVIEIEPENADHYANREEIYKTMGSVEVADQ